MTKENIVNFIVDLKRVKGKFLFIILAFLVIPSFLYIIRPGFYSMHDDLQAFRIQQMDKCFADLQIPCRWIPDMGYQYGYPQFNYYPPSVYYIGGIIHLLGFEFIDTVKVLVALGFLLGAFFMFLFLKDFLGVWPALVGSLLYTYAPYKSVDVYVRGALSEFWALVFFPLIFWSSYKLIKNEKIKNVAFFALSIALLLLTHNLMTLIFFPVAVVWVGYHLYAEQKWRMLPKVISGGFLGLGLAAFFTLPALLEKQYVHMDSMVSGYFDYRMHFADLNQLFFSNYWGYGSSVWGPNDELSLSTGQIHWILGVIAVFLSIILFKKYKKIAFLTFVLAITELFILFMMHSKSIFIWQIFEPILVWMQFPWRLLGVSIFILSVMGGILIFLIEKINTKVVSVCSIFVIIGLFVLYSNVFKPHAWSDISDKDKFSGELWEKQLTISIFDYLPIYSEFPPVTKAPKLPEVMDGKVEFLNYKKGSHYQIGELEVLEAANIRLPLFDFPGMKVWVNQKEVPHRNDDCRGQEFCLGLISVDLSPGRHVVKAELTNTPIRTLGNSLSLLSIAVLAGILLKSRKYK